MKKILLLISAMVLIWLTFFLVGCCCPTCEQTVYYSSNGKPFPAEWGSPPEIQTKDYRPLPHGYGHGSSTLYNWITKNTQKDFQRKFNNLPSTGTF